MNTKSTNCYLKMCLFGCSSEERSAEARAREAERNLSLILELIRLSKDKASGESDNPQVRFLADFLCSPFLHVFSSLMVQIALHCWKLAAGNTVFT